MKVLKLPLRSLSHDLQSICSVLLALLLLLWEREQTMPRFTKHLKRQNGDGKEITLAACSAANLASSSFTRFLLSSFCVVVEVGAESKGERLLRTKSERKEIAIVHLPRRATTCAVECGDRHRRRPYPSTNEFANLFLLFQRVRLCTFLFFVCGGRWAAPGCCRLQSACSFLSVRAAP